MPIVSLQSSPIDVADMMSRLDGRSGGVGARAFFLGDVRDDESNCGQTLLTLEIYPAMTEKSLREIAEEAERRWSLSSAAIAHRHGTLEVGETIVFVGASAAHRDQAFDGARFMIDRLKTDAPFWKRQSRGRDDPGRWINPEDRDRRASKRWNEN